MTYFHRFGLIRRASHNKRDLVRYLVQHPLRSRYRERVLRFHLDTLPRLKHGAQSRIYGYILTRRRRRAEKTGILELVRRQAPRFTPGPRLVSAPRHATRARGAGHIGRKKMLSYTQGQGAPGEYGDEDVPAERGYRRKRLAAMAGSMYRAGASAVTEIKESYAQTRVVDPFEERPSIPGSFPDASIVTSHNSHEQLVLFPTYAKRHVKRDPRRTPQPYQAINAPPGSLPVEEDYNSEWDHAYDPDAVIDVDVRGWIYAPSMGPLTRKNRILMGLARRLSGIPRLDARPSPETENYRPGVSPYHEDLGEQEKIAAEAARIERIGLEERKAANYGEYSEVPNTFGAQKRQRQGSPASLRPPSPPLSGRPGTATTDLTEAELVTANANLAARIAPFLTTPLCQLPITVFFYNESRSQSRTVLTNEAGHFNLRAALPFVPTHVRVLANESLSAVQEIKVTESAGVSLISDIDDTVKRSNISGGAREIFRNTFVRELTGLTVEGVKEWYSSMAAMGVGLHYCSNSPWQLYPVLTTFFKMSGLPPGSMHLKAYNGMLQGIFEPVAERKKPTLERILGDFPERKFILVGDSGEADLEVYTDLALANPGRILAIFIRDVTTPEQPGFFDSSFGTAPQRPGNGYTKGDEKKARASDSSDMPSNRPALPPRAPVGLNKQDEVPTGNLIDFSDDDTKPSQEAQLRADTARSAGTKPEPSTRTPPPPRPVKPIALRSNTFEIKDMPSAGGRADGLGTAYARPRAPPPPTRKPVGSAPQRTTSPHPLSQAAATPGGSTGGWGRIPTGLDGDRIPTGLGGEAPRPVSNPSRTNTPVPPPPPPPRRSGTPSAAARTNMKDDGPATLRPRPSTSYDPAAPPPQAAPGPQLSALQRSGTASSTSLPGASSSQDPNYASANKKLELWRRRLDRAQEVLEDHGVALYTWRKGYDVMHEAMGIVKAALEEGGEAMKAGDRTKR